MIMIGDDFQFAFHETLLPKTAVYKTKKWKLFLVLEDSNSVTYSLFTDHCFQLMFRRQTKNKVIFSFRYLLIWWFSV